MVLQVNQVINPRGDVVSDPNKKKTITMAPDKGVIGEDGKQWLAGETHDASEPFADDLVRRGMAEEGFREGRAEEAAARQTRLEAEQRQARLDEEARQAALRGELVVGPRRK